MKSKIHPQYNQAVFVCNTCKTEYQLGSTVDSVRVELCANCHPFYTGKETLVDTDSLVDKFNKKRVQATSSSAALKSKKEKRAARKEKAGNRTEVTLKDMLTQVK